MNLVYLLIAGSLIPFLFNLFYKRISRPIEVSPDAMAFTMQLAFSSLIGFYIFCTFSTTAALVCLILVIQLLYFSGRKILYARRNSLLSYSRFISEMRRSIVGWSVGFGYIVLILVLLRIVNRTDDGGWRLLQNQEVPVLAFSLWGIVMVLVQVSLILNKEKKVSHFEWLSLLTSFFILSFCFWVFFPKDFNLEVQFFIAAFAVLIFAPAVKFANPFKGGVSETKKFGIFAKDFIVTCLVLLIFGLWIIP